MSDPINLLRNTLNAQLANGGMPQLPPVKSVIPTTSFIVTSVKDINNNTLNNLINQEKTQAAFLKNAQDDMVNLTNNRLQYANADGSWKVSWGPTYNSVNNKLQAKIVEIVKIVEVNRNRTTLEINLSKMYMQYMADNNELTSLKNKIGGSYNDLVLQRYKFMMTNAKLSGYWDYISYLYDRDRNTTAGNIVQQWYVDPYYGVVRDSVNQLTYKSEQLMKDIDRMDYLAVQVPIEFNALKTMSSEFATKYNIKVL